MGRRYEHFKSLPNNRAGARLLGPTFGFQGGQLLGRYYCCKLRHFTKKKSGAALSEHSLCPSWGSIVRALLARKALLRYLRI